MRARHWAQSRRREEGGDVVSILRYLGFMCLVFRVMGLRFSV